jgi:NAD-dependent isocitrate dehydrogenase
LPGIKTKFSDVNLIIVRENIEDTYAGIEHMQSPDVAQCLRIITRSGSERIARYAFELARREKRKKVTAVHKANIMKLTDGLFLETFKKVAAEYSDIESGDIIVDNCCMQAVTKPSQFDVLVLPNLFGDIVSDLCAGLIGGLGVAPSANIGKNYAVFEAVHGSAPDIAGKGLANPTAILLSATAMLRHMHMLDKSESIERALNEVLDHKKECTKDIGGEGNTQSFTDAIISRIR